MIEYPSILNPSKAPRQPCIAFEKYDGSNIRVKWTRKRGFDLFGSRTQLFDATHPHLGKCIALFNAQYKEPLEKLLFDEFTNEREAIAFGEYLGDKSFAGIHDPEDTTMRFILFDLFVGHKNPKFLYPQDFIRIVGRVVPIAREIYHGNFSDQFIDDVRTGKYNVSEGAVAKSTERNGAFRGGIWMAKVKTWAYLDRVLKRYGQEGLKLYGE